MFFSGYTALTSSTGAIWNNNNGQTFNGIPEFDAAGNVTSGIGKVYVGYNSTIAGTGIISSTYTPKAATGTLKNAVTVQTNHGEVTFYASGNLGSTIDVSSLMPSTLTVDGQTFNLAPSQTVKATIGQTMATAVIDGSGNANSIGNPVNYTGKNNPASTINISDSTGKVTGSVIIPEGHAGDAAATVTVDAPKGYVPSTKTVTVEYSSTGTPTLKDDKGNVITPADITYSGVDNPASTINVTDSKGKATGSVIIPDGKYGDDPTTVTVTAPDGYTPSTKTVTVTYGTEGTPILKDDKGNVITPADITYSGVDNPESSINVKNPDGSDGTSVKIPEGNYGDPDGEVTLPSKDGYDTPKLTVKYGTDGTPTITDQDGNTVDATHPYQYTGKQNDATTLNVKNPDGTTSKLDIPAGRYGDEPKTITAEDKPGYKAPSVVVTFGADGTPVFTDPTDPTKTIDSADVLTYKRISSGNSHVVVDPDAGVGTIEKKQQTIATFSDRPDVAVYALDANNKMTATTDRILPHQTNWMSDETITIDGTTYYRVATNEWAKADQVYPYEAVNFFIRTYDDSVKLLYAAEGNIVKNRSLAISSSWTADRVTYVINGKKYYRVATNEFVSADDAYVYTPVRLNVRTTAGAVKNLYTAKGVLIKNRTVNPLVNLRADSITYINGEKYYRVATNEFIKVEDVETY